MKVLVIHDSDEVKAVFVSDNDELILKALKESEYWEDVIDRLETIHYENHDGDDIDFAEDMVTLYDVVQLCHDGDSEDGYTLLQGKKVEVID